MDADFGEGILQNSYYRLSCECVRDSAFFRLLKIVPDQPVLQNALVQVGTNFEVTPLILNENVNPGAHESFKIFLETEAKDALGFGLDEFKSSMNALRQATKSDEYDRFETASNVPSCVAAIEVGMELFPDWNPDTGEARID